MIRWIEVDVIRSDHHHIGLLAGSERSALIHQAGAGGSADGRAFENLSHANKGRSFRVTVSLAIGRHCPLYVKGDTHLGEHVGAVRYLVVDAEAGTHSMIDSFLQRGDTLAQRVLRI